MNRPTNTSFSVLTRSQNAVEVGQTTWHAARPGANPLFALEKTADYYVVAYTKVGPTCSVAFNF